MTDAAPLPVDALLPALAQALAERGGAVLEAPPGAGKTTRVPLALLASVPGRILMLEPRRVAARAAAERLAAELGEVTGGQVGYRMRGESRPGSRIEVVTEGILTRLLQASPDLPGVGCVIFDEFHERSLQADLGLALALEARAALRPDLRLLVMSATLDAGPVAALLGEAPRLTSEGRAFPVETRWLDRPAPPGRRLEEIVAAGVLETLEASSGGVLVFLPGQAEIGRAAARLGPRLPPGVVLQRLHGGLGLAEQRAVLAPLPPEAGRRVVLATAIAETSLTIPDVRAVVDAGLARRSRFDPGSGMSRLVTEKVTRAEAAQRRGRAGRTAPGWCLRLWTKGEEGALAPFPPPEIASADLTGLALELAVWGSPDGTGLAFLTPPPAPALAEARALLADLGAVDARGHATNHGRRLAAMPVHPRLAHMLAEAPSPPSPALAALMEARDPVSAAAGGRAPADLGLRLAALADPDRAEREAPVRVDRAALPALRAEARRLAPRGPATATAAAGLSPGAALSLAYPDRIARRREGTAPRFLLANGKGAALDPGDGLAGLPWLVAADLDGDPREARIRRALPVAEAELRTLHAARLRREEVVEWSRRDRAVAARQRLMLGAIALEDRPWRAAPPEAVAAALAAGVRELGLGVLPWTDAARRLLARAAFLRARGDAELPDLSEPALLSRLDTWLPPWLAGMRSVADLAGLDMMAVLDGLIGATARARLDRLAPASILAPTGTRLALDYSGEVPQAAVRLQEMFGTTEHPTAAGVPVLFELLSPAGRPVQLTADLPGFWRTSYADVRRDLRGRYPRHPWPEDPAAAPPTRRAKPRGT